MTADAIKWQQEAQSRKLRADNLQLIAQVEQLKSITGPLQHLSIEQIITSGNIDTVTGRSQVSAAPFHGVRGAHNLFENWPVEHGLTPLAPNWVYSQVRVQ